jgi:hypothetical protein
MASCEGKLAKFKIPREVRFIDALPVTRRAGCKRRCRSLSTGTAPVPGREAGGRSSVRGAARGGRCIQQPSGRTAATPETRTNTVEDGRAVGTCSHLTKLRLQLFEPRSQLVSWRGIMLHTVFHLTPRIRARGARPTASPSVPRASFPSARRGFARRATTIQSAATAPGPVPVH